MVRMLRSAAVLLILLALPPSGWAATPDPSAGQLARSVDAALAAAAEAAKAPKGGLDSKNPRHASFLLALHDFRARVGQIEAALAPRKPELYLLVDQGSSDLGELRVAWARTGVMNDRISAAVQTASVSYRHLRADYGREGLRRRQGSAALSDAERQQLQRLQGAEQRFAASLQPLRDRARAKGDATTAAELERFRAEAESVAVAAADLSTYLNALIAASELRGEWNANLPYIKKSAPPAELAAADDTVQDLYVDSDIGQVFTADLGAAPADGAEAASATGSAATPGAGGGTVEVYQASPEGPREVVVAEPVADADDPADAADAADGGAVVVEPVVETEPAGAGAAEKPAAAEAKKPAPQAPQPGAPATAPPPAPPPIG